MYAETTRSIRVTAEPFFIAPQSDPQRARWVFGYTITLENLGSETVQLLDRHWLITDGRGERTEVRGAGVIGKQPVLEPGERFEYSSGTPLGTPSGIMVGSYSMIVSATQERFEVRIPAFSLDAPGAKPPLN